MLKTDLTQTFLEAAAKGDLEELKKHLEQGVDINSTNKQKQTAILIAALNNHHTAVKFLVDAGADINVQDQTCLNPFLYGCIKGDVELVKLMIRAGADVELVTRFGGVGITPASEKGHIEVVRELVSTTDINVNHTNYCGWTPLIEAIILNDGGEIQQAIIKLLLEHGADPQMVDQYGITPLELARRKGYTEIEKILLEAGAV
ncbi:ankyrin repeat domain-containing protein [Alkalihalobacillus sp. BA299]|uniref:ankyrin repeat domain-containing protein n=1 Tax=Alkalihalobacillus sp. BA299 TaxID=2815938 RepID=UPI001ADB23BE|nr:ankyrin repeat domain-containing protein [Alkalihalobacillus sp. BA299]